MSIGKTEKFLAQCESHLTEVLSKDSASFDTVHTLCAAVTTVPFIDTQQSPATVVAVRKIYTTVFEIFQKFHTRFAPQQNDNILEFLITTSGIRAEKVIFSNGIEKTVINVLLTWLITIESNYRSAPVEPSLHIKAHGTLIITLNQLSLGNLISVDQEQTLEIVQRCARIFALCAPSIDRESRLAIVDGFIKTINTIDSTQLYAKKKDLFISVLLQTCDTLLQSVIEQSTGGKILGLSKIYYSFAQAMNPLFDNTSLINQASAETLQLLYLSLMDLSDREAVPNEFKRVVKLFHQNMASAIALVKPTFCIDAIAGRLPEKVSPIELRNLEDLLICDERNVRQLLKGMTLQALELFCIGLHRVCLSKGMSWESHPSDMEITLRPPSGIRTSLHLQMEESICTGNLDVACASCCHETPSIETEQWQLFTLRAYLMKFIAIHKRQCTKGLKEQKILFPSSSPHSIDFFSIPYSDPAVQEYDQMRMARTDMSQAHVLTTKASNSFYRFYCELRTHAERVQKRFGASWAEYDRGVAVFEKCVVAHRGYKRNAPMAPTFPVHGPLVFIDPLKASDERSFRDVHLNPLLTSLMLKGELGLAETLCEILSPGNNEFAALFLKEMGLMVAIEEETSEHIKNSPSPTSACIASEQRPEKKAAATGKISRPKSEGSERRRPGSGLKAPRDLATEFKSLSVSAPSKTPSPISSPKEPVLSPGLSPLSKEDEKIVLPTATSMTLSPKVKKIRFFDVEKQLQEQIRDIDGRIHRWKAQWFASHSDDSLDFHTYPFQIASLVRAFGEKEQWASTRTGLLNDHYVCIGEIHRYSKGKDPVLGVFSEAFSKEDNKLYHHFFHPRNMSHLTQRFQETRSFFDTDSAGTQKVQSEFQKFLFEKAKKEGSFFDSLDGIPPKKCCKDRFFVQINGATIRVDDTNFGTAYTLTAKL